MTNITYPDFDYSLNANKLLQTNDGDIDILLNTYNISHKTMEEMINSVRDWYTKQPHLPQGQLHDRMILGQLITRGFRVEQCKEKIDYYFAARHKMADLLCNWEPLPPNMAKFLKQGYWVVSPYKTKENHRIVIIRVINPEDMVVSDVTKLGFLIGDYRLFNDTTQGTHLVYDFSKSTFKNALELTPMLLSKIYFHITSCYALKIKGIHLVNVPSFGLSILNVVKKMMKNKHVSRLHLYESFETIFDVLPKETFPSDLGGTAALTSEEICNNWYETFSSTSWRGFFKQAETCFFTDESKRTERSNIGDTYGVEGSFRQIQLD